MTDNANSKNENQQKQSSLNEESNTPNDYRKAGTTLAKIVVSAGGTVALSILGNILTPHVLAIIESVKNLLSFATFPNQELDENMQKLHRLSEIYLILSKLEKQDEGKIKELSDDSRETLLSAWEEFLLSDAPTSNTEGWIIATIEKLILRDSLEKKLKR